jgi:hypothetical protein
MANDSGEDPYARQYKDNEPPYLDISKDYELEKVDKDSVDEIRKLLKGGRYKDPEYLKEHLEYLENLIQKLWRIYQEEKKTGKMNLSLERDLAKIKELFAQLSTLLDTLESK